MTQNPQLAQETSEHIHLSDRQLDTALFLQTLENLHCQHPFSFRLILRSAEILMIQLLLNRFLLKFTITFRLPHTLFARKPITLPIIQCSYRLSIKLLIIYRLRIIYFRNMYTDKTTAAARVIQQIFVIAGGNERSIATHFLYISTVGTAHIDRRLLQQMLQEALMTDTDLIELIQINQRKTIQIEHGMALFAEIQIIRIIKM